MSNLITGGLIGAAIVTALFLFLLLAGAPESHRFNPYNWASDNRNRRGGYQPRGSSGRKKSKPPGPE